jgi:hypothetical protein
VISLLNPLLHPLHKWFSYHCGCDVDDKCLVKALCFFWYWHVDGEIITASKALEDVIDAEAFIEWAKHVADLMLLQIYNNMR